MTPELISALLTGLAGLMGAAGALLANRQRAAREMLLASQREVRERHFEPQLPQRPVLSPLEQLARQFDDLGEPGLARLQRELDRQLAS